MWNPVLSKRPLVSWCFYLSVDKLECWHIITLLSVNCNDERIICWIQSRWGAGPGQWPEPVPPSSVGAGEAGWWEMATVITNTQAPAHLPPTSSRTQITHHIIIIIENIEIIIRQWWVMVDSVSISITSAIVYGVSGGLFFLLIFLLILIGLCNCNCDNYRCGD